MRRRLLSFAVPAVALSLAACGGDDAVESGAPVATAAPGTAAPTGSGADGATAPVPEVNELPAVTVVDVATGEPVVVADYAPADRPILVWMWAPH